jgi:4-hydroxythreonine-4-phosphate dehydrogenase
MKPSIGITIGDPCGIGPEVTLKALRALAHERWHAADLVVYGDADLLRATVEHCLPSGPHAAVPLVDLANFGPELFCPGSCMEGGRAAMEYVDAAVSDLKSGRIHALVTGPVSKEAVQMTRPGFIGHTEYLAAAFSVERPVMMMAGGGLRVALVTTHCALKEVPGLVTEEAVFETIRIVDGAMQKYFGVKAPRIAVCGLNPHAAEDAPWTREDREVVAPGVKRAAREKINCAGPLAADTVFHRALHGEFDAVVAMYHDQGLGPLKTVAFESAVNVTLGLPIVRTSPGHGTAYDIAGKGLADACSMTEAIKLAAHMARSRTESGS